jgi:hypothetical protein
MAERRSPAVTDLITVPAQVIGMKPRADRSWKLEFETRELAGDEVKILADNFQGEGWLLFRPNPDSGIESAEIPNTDADAGMESPSIKLRKRLWLLWKQQGSKGSFDNFYLTYIQRFMEFIESKLEGGPNA